MNLSATNFITLYVQMTKSACTFIIDSGADISIIKWKGVSHTQKCDRTKTFKITGVTDGILETIAETET